MTKEEYKKRLDWLFPKNEDDEYPARILARRKLERNYNFHNRRIVYKMCIYKMYDLIGIKNGKKLFVKIKVGKQNDNS